MIPWLAFWFNYFYLSYCCFSFLVFVILRLTQLTQTGTFYFFKKADDCDCISFVSLKFWVLFLEKRSNWRDDSLNFFPLVESNYRTLLFIDYLCLKLFIESFYYNWFYFNIWGFIEKNGEKESFDESVDREKPSGVNSWSAIV